MVNYSKTERYFSKLLSHFPRIKLFIKKSYQILNYIIYKKSKKKYTNYSIYKIEDGNNETFFGYYDKSPLNRSNKYLIFHSTDYSTTKTPCKNNPVEIVLYNFIENGIIKKYRSHSYNWQQGAKLQWIDAKRFIYNDFDKEKKHYFSKIVNSKNTKVEKIINYPIYDVYNDIALTINFDRLNILRPDYGYRNRKANIDFSKNKIDGIFLINFKNNTSNLIISLDDVIKLHYKKNMQNAKHWFNHIMISPNGEKFIFLHRWLVGNRKFDSLIISDINGKNIHCIADDDMVSHCYWKNNYEIVAYLRDNIKKDRYYLINIMNNTKKIIGEGVIDKFGDGHPSIYRDKMLFDTYPNKSRMKELYIYNMKNNFLKKIGEFFESLKYYNETRCDLHPRFSYDGKKLFFDSVHTGKRKLYYLDLREKL